MCLCVFKGLICVYTFQFFPKKLLSSSELQTLCMQVDSEVFMESPPLHNKNLKPLSPEWQLCAGEKISGRRCFSEKWTFRGPHWAADLHLLFFGVRNVLKIDYKLCIPGPRLQFCLSNSGPSSLSLDGTVCFCCSSCWSWGSHALICSENDSNLSACCNFRFVEVKLCSSDIS